jgi:hypothetical protein
MFSITLKRSAATLGVVAGLLAAAAPASAQILEGPLMWDTPRANTTWGPIIEAIGLNALGTQVGSEGLITYNGHAGLGSNSLAQRNPHFALLREASG